MKYRTLLDCMYSVMFWALQKRVLFSSLKTSTFWNWLYTDIRSDTKTGMNNVMRGIIKFINQQDKNAIKWANAEKFFLLLPNFSESSASERSRRASAS